jgi:hypothetical protein
MTLWLKPNVLAGTTFVEGALPALYSSTSTYAIGLLNRYVRQGFITLDPRLWGQPQGTAGCSTNQGAAGGWVECGAVPLPMIQHMPPNAMVN